MMLVHVSDLVLFIYCFTILDCGYLNISLFMVSHWETFFKFFFIQFTGRKLFLGTLMKSESK
jgi:hypothetical protein